MNINKEQLKKAFKDKQWDVFFTSATVITEFLCSKIYKISCIEEKEDIIQECLLNLHKKVIEGKIQEDNNIFSFIWANSRFRIMEILRKDRKRKLKATFISYDDLENCFYTDGEVFLEIELTA